MKRFTFIALLSAAVFCGCVKSDDFDALGHDIEINGQLRPALGLPIGHASMNIADLLGTWQDLGDYLTCDPDTRFLSFVYSGTFDNTTVFGNSSHKTGHGRKSDPDAVSVYTKHYAGAVNIDLFTNVDGVDLIGTNVTLQSLIRIYGRDDYEEMMNRYKINPYFSDIKITVIGQTGNLEMTPAGYTDSITVAELVEGKNLILADHEDLSACLRIKPAAIRYEMDLNIEYTVSYLESLEITDAAKFFKDSIMLDSLTTHTTIDANFPLQIKTDDFKYNVEMPMSFETVDSALSAFRERISFGDSSYLALRFINTLPISFEMNDTLLDEHNKLIRYADNSLAHIYQPNTPIKAAVLKDTLVGGQHYSVSNGVPVETILKANISDRNMDALLRTRKMRLGIKVSSGMLSGSVPEHVTIRRDDHLESYLYIVTNPESMQ